jgi:hypothetical protein
MDVRKYVDDISTAMFREIVKDRCIHLFIRKIKELKIKLTDEEKKILRQAMIPGID